ncbi:MAG: hypothetical protein IH605_16720 [Burkholderiales bacterium]|nr:hypothetical protein [Burkholderiales bacterium]
MYQRFIVAWALFLATAAPLAWAQPAANGSIADPQDAEAPVPPVIYRSPLANYRVLSDDTVTSWKETNDNVGRIGGWRAYAKEAQEPEPAIDPTPPNADKSVPADDAKPMQGRMRGHKMN